MLGADCLEPGYELLLHIGVLNLYNILNLPPGLARPAEEISNDFIFESACVNDRSIAANTIGLLTRQDLCHDVEAREVPLWLDEESCSDVGGVSHVQSVRFIWMFLLYAKVEFFVALVCFKWLKVVLPSICYHPHCFDCLVPIGCVLANVHIVSEHQLSL